MAPAAVEHRCVARALRVLDGPLVGVYPFPPGEDAATWRQRCAEALHTIGERELWVRADRRGDTLAQSVDRLLIGGVASSLALEPGAVRLLGELLRNLAEPGRINQGHKGTCAVTCVEVHLALRHPAEYARLVVGLAGPTGAVELSPGVELLRDEEALRWTVAEARRSPVSRLLQVALMELAYPNLDYRNLDDGHFEPVSAAPGAPTDLGPAGAAGGDRNTGSGVGLGAFDRLLEAVTGETWETLSVEQSRVADRLAALGLDTSSLPDIFRDGLSIVERSARAGESVFVTLETETSRDRTVRRVGEDPLRTLPHKVRVYDLRAGRVYFEDPLDPVSPWMEGAETEVIDAHGRSSMPLEVFRRLMVELSYRPRFARVNAAAGDASAQEPG